MAKIAFDLDEFETIGPSNEGRWLTLKTVSGNEDSKSKSGKVRRIKLVGPDSTAYRQAMLDTVNEQIEEDLPPLARQDRAIENGLSIMAKCTLDWEGIEDRDGNPIPVSEEYAKALYRAYPAVRLQVDNFITARRNFTLASPKV